MSSAGRMPALSLLSTSSKPGRSLDRIARWQAMLLALDGGYDTTAEALEEIDGRVREFYEEEHPEVLENGFGELLDEGIEELRTIYQRTIFPEMKADWRAHPNNLGHRDSLGCFRCHNDEMVDEDGEAIFTDCQNGTSVSASPCSKTVGG